MNRRRFAGLFAGLMAIPAAVAAQERNLMVSMSGSDPVTFPDTAVEGTTRNGFRIIWKDFLPSQSNDLLVGQWLAWRRGRYIVSTTTGYLSPYRPGDEFDISWRWRSMEPITSFSPSRDLEKVKYQALEELLSFIDKEPA